MISAIALAFYITVKKYNEFKMDWLCLTGKTWGSFLL